jgi:hypothetical protein
VFLWRPNQRPVRNAGGNRMSHYVAVSRSERTAETVDRLATVQKIIRQHRSEGARRGWVTFKKRAAERIRSREN